MKTKSILPYAVDRKLKSNYVKVKLVTNSPSLLSCHPIPTLIFVVVLLFVFVLLLFVWVFVVVDKTLLSPTCLGLIFISVPYNKIYTRCYSLVQVKGSMPPSLRLVDLSLLLVTLNDTALYTSGLHEY